MKKIRYAFALLVVAGATAGLSLPGHAATDGVCTDLGCVGGETKCADGTLEYPEGQIVNYTCYTTLPSIE